MNQVDQIDELIRGSLIDFAGEALAEGWYGREAESINLFVFGHLLKRVNPTGFLKDPRQIRIQGAVPQLGRPRQKPQVVKDLVLWSEPGMSCWDEKRRPTVYPAAVVEWKVAKAILSSQDLEWLCSFSSKSPNFVGYAVGVDLKRRTFGLLAARVFGGNKDEQWLVVMS